MDKIHNTAPGDIVDEAYKGPSVATAIAGEGYIAHFQWAFIGLLVGGIGSVVFHNPLNRAIASVRIKSEALRETGAALKEGKGVWNGIVANIKSAAGSLGGWVFGRGEKEFVHIKKTIESAGPLDNHTHEALMALESKEKGIGHWLADHAIPFMSKAKKREMIACDGRWEAAAIGGGLLGSMGFFLSPAFFAHSGYRKGVAGKDQFGRLQNEVITTRAERDALLTKYADVKTELDALKVGGADHKLAVAKDNPPDIDQARDSIAALSGVNTDSPTGPSAPVIGPAPTTGRTLPGEPPRIKEPVIGPEHAAWSDRMAARAAETATHETARA